MFENRAKHLQGRSKDNVLENRGLFVVLRVNDNVGRVFERVDEDKGKVVEFDGFDFLFKVFKFSAMSLVQVIVFLFQQANFRHHGAHFRI